MRVTRQSHIELSSITVVVRCRDLENSCRDNKGENLDW